LDESGLRNSEVLAAQRLVQERVAAYTRAKKAELRIQQSRFNILYFGGSSPGTWRVLTLREWLPTSKACFWAVDDHHEKKIYYVDLIGGLKAL
jgi:hypothetical protein